MIKCKSIWSKFRGLMFSSKKELLFIFNNEERRSIHMFFVFYPITVAFLDSNYIIREIKRLYPFQIYFSKEKCKYIFETPFPIDLKVNKKLKV